ncbi:MAG: Murein hydrolase activator EnvC [Ignavibacteriaceae bacterium]|nr:Murein hydrolase activator EnvC [Ignavibacteriaceae bacterium]
MISPLRLIFSTTLRNNFQVFHRWVAILLAVFLLLSFEGHNQQGDIKKKQNELAAIKKEIQTLKDEISKASKEEKKTWELIEKLNKQVYLLNQLVNGLTAEAENKTKQISQLETEISSLNRKISDLREFYARFVVATYKGLIKNKWLYIINSSSFDEALTRYRYFKIFTDKGEQVLGDYQSAVEKLEVAKATLQAEKEAKANILAQKKNEESALVAGLDEQKDALKNIGKNKEALKKQLEAKQQSEKKIGSIIDKLVAKEESSKKNKEKKQPTKTKTKPPVKTTPKPKSSDQVAENKSGKGGVGSKESGGWKESKESGTPATSGKSRGADETIEKDEEVIGGSPVEDYEETTVSGKSFSSLKGNLKKPVVSAKVFRGYGENKNEELNTVTVNYGIDFQVEGAQPVRCVADGVVSAIEWLPGYGSVVIITHTEGYRTVYGHLGTISVREGSRVGGGSVIGTVGRSIEGFIFHFEIWKGRQNLNPSSWF